VTIRLSHRGIFNRFLTSRGLSDKSEEILRTVDKLAKIGEEETLRLLTELAGTGNAPDILKYIKGAGSRPEDFEATLDLMESMAGGPAEDTKRMRDISSFMLATGIQDSYVLDPSITRGLDYYTGVVYETFLKDLPSIGSVCSGGRYDNLAGLYMKDRIPGVGSSIGLDRLIAGLEELGALKDKKSFTVAAFFNEDESRMSLCQKAADYLRNQGIPCEVFPEAKKMGQQYAWAEKKGIPWGLTLEGSSQEGLPGEEIPVTLKNLATRETRSVTAKEAAKIIRGAL
jgi:histidyl-tRNA synthetase